MATSRFQTFLKDWNSQHFPWSIAWVQGVLPHSDNESVIDFEGTMCFGSTKHFDPVFDLASLTKVVGAGTLLVDTARQLGLELDTFFEQSIAQLASRTSARPDSLLAEAAQRMGELTLRSLLEHRSGFAAHELIWGGRPAAGSREERWRFALPRLVQHLQSGAALASANTVYSDLGFLVLNLVCEQIWKQDIDSRWKAWRVSHLDAWIQARPYQNQDVILQYGTAGIDPARVMPTEARHTVGEVNDDNAAALGGVASHAGLFGNVRGLRAWLEVIWNCAQNQRAYQAWVSPNQRKDSVHDRFYFGWDQAQDSQSSHAGENFPAGVIGHLGYTGTALWWHPLTGRFGVLLTNRVHSSEGLGGRLNHDALADSKQMVYQLRRAFFTDLWERQ